MVGDLAGDEKKTLPEPKTTRLAIASPAETRKGSCRSRRWRGDVASGGEEMNLGFWILGVLEFRVRGSPELEKV
jgi:hypothetical protein